MEKAHYIEAIKKAREAKKRRFSQSFDLAVSLRHIDLKKPQNKIDTELTLPHGRGKGVTVAIIADGELAKKASEFVQQVISPDELNKLGKDRKNAKKIAGQFDFFVVQVNLMQNFAKSLGPVLGPRGKMPKPSQIIPPQGDPEAVVKGLKSKIRLTMKSQPVLHAFVGHESQNDEDIAENVLAVVNFLEHKLENPIHQIHSIYIKMTMGPAIRIGGE